MKLSSHTQKQLIDSNIDSIVVTNHNCNIEYANKATIKLYGYSLDELTGKNISVFNVSGKEESSEAWDILERTGEWAGEALRQKKDGSIFYASLSLFTIFDERGEIIGFVSNTKDITQTISITNALVQKQYQLKSIVDNTVDVIVSIDKDLNIVEFNKVLAGHVKTGFSHELKKGDPLLEYIDPSKHDKLKKIYTKVFTGERVFDIEIFKSRDGSSIYFESSYNPIFDENNIVNGISIFSKDISNRVKSEQALKKAYDEKEILLAEIHHRIKNNLAIISSVLQLQEININNEEAIKCLRESRMRIKSAALLHEMLYQKNSLDKLYVKQYLYKMFEDINNSIGSKNHKLNIQGDDVSLFMHNAIPVGLLFNELFTNSVKHGFKGITQGEIDITVKNKDKYTQFEITENEGVFPDEIDIEDAHSTGLLLIKYFTEQLNGNVKLLKTPKTKYILSLDLT